MYKSLLAVAVVGGLAWSSPAQAQTIYVDAYRPVTTYYAPAAPVVTYSPVTGYPVTTYYSPVPSYPVVTYSPVATYAPVYAYSPVAYPVTAYRPYPTYYAAPVYYAPYYVPFQPVRNVLRSVFGPF